MNGIQRVIKVFAICLAIVLIVNIVGWIIFGISCFVGISEMVGTESSESNVSVSDEKDNYVYTEEVYKNIEKINIDIAYAELNIRTGGDVLTVQMDKSNRKIKVDVKNDTLRIREDDEWFWRDNRHVVIDVIMPKDMDIRDFNLDAGAGKIKIDGIDVDRANIDHGAGKLEILNSNFDKVNLNGGAGAIYISSSVLNDLKFDAGVGKVDISADITGDSKIECGVGGMDITLLGNEDNYKILGETGIRKL